MQVSPKPNSTPQSTPTSPETITLNVGGMKCAGCVKAVERQLTQTEGTISACVNLATEVATVEYRPDTVDPDRLAEKLTDAGFPSQPRRADDEGSDRDLSEARQQEIRQLIRQVFIAGALIVLSGIGHLDRFGWDIPILSNMGFHFALATVALLVPGRDILIDGWRGLSHNAPNMNTLVGLGAISAYLASVVALAFPNLGWECFFDEPVMILGFILLGRTLERQARDRAADSLRSLMDLKPAVARLVADPDRPEQSPVEIPAHQVRPGEWVQVLPGEKIPVDGELVKGSTTVDESMLTGESISVTKQAGETLTGGTLNQSGAIVLQATRTGRDTTLAQIVSLVEDAQTRKAPVQQLADTVAGYFTYGIMAIAALTFSFWYFAGTHIWSEVVAASAAPSGLLLSLKLAIAVLVIACPCALGLATPTAILVGTGIGAGRGVLIRGGDVLERVRHLDTVVFDKTGTLTVGQPRVTDCESACDGCDADTVLQLAATVESGARHPLAEAIGTQARDRQLSLRSADDFRTEAGLGVSALIGGDRVWVGSSSGLEQHEIAIDPPVRDRAQALASEGKTVVYVARDQTVIGLIAARDRLRDHARQTVNQLQQWGLQVVLLTGDRRQAAEAIATEVGIAPANVIARVRPEEKAGAIAELQGQNRQVAMVGDGINDAPALAQANVGISLHGGTDVAIETAQIVLMHADLLDLVESIRLSRATFAKIRQNLFWAFAYNTVGIPVAAGVLLPGFGIALNPAVAAALMAFSSVSVVTNSLLLRHQFRSSQPPA